MAVLMAVLAVFLVVAGLVTAGASSAAAASALDLAEQELLNRAPSSMIVLATGGAGPTGSARTRLDRQLGISRTALAVVADPAVTSTWEPSATASGGTVVQAPADHLADAFDQLDDTMRRRYTVSFTPPPGAPPGGTARLTIQAGGEQLAADVPLPG